MFTVAVNHEYDEIGRVKFVKSSLKSHPLWVTLSFDSFPGIK